MIKDSSNSFSSWFKTPYYHMLHSKNALTEAHAFLETLTNYLNLPEQRTILNLTSGKDEYALQLAKLGYNVTSSAVSENNSDETKTYRNENLQFIVDDTSKAHKQQFDAVFNLFSHFGSADFDEDYLNTIKTMKAHLNETGFGVIDVMNTDVVIEHLIPEEIKTIGEIDFNLKRYVENGHIIKDIRFETDDKTLHFQERMKVFSLKDFELLFEQADMYLLDVFGDYKLNKYRSHTSEHVIMIFK